MSADLLPGTTRINITKQIIVTPTITANSAYTSGFQLGGIMSLANVIRQYTTSGTSQSELHSVTVLDATGQSAAIDLKFFAISPTLTNVGDFTAFSITGANQIAASAQGHVSILTTNYSASAAASEASTGNISLNCVIPSTSANPTTLYCIAVVRGTPTYTSTTALTFIFNFYVD